MKITHTDAALIRAIEKVGGASAASRLLDVTPQAISQWRRAPALRVIAIERISGVPRHQLRPDIYPPNEVAA